MTIIKGRDIPTFLKNRPASAHVVLIYGPDQGMVRDRALGLGKQIVEDLTDPFNAAELNETDLSEPGRLSDEAVALSFMGGERLIRVRSGGPPVANAVTLLLSGIDDGRLSPNAVTIIEAGDLKKSNALRKVCEASRHAAAIGCYPDTARDLRQTINDQLSEDDLKINDDALALLSSFLGDDRGITRSAVEALILYKGPKGLPREDDTITIDDVRLCAVDSAADATFDIIDAALSGEATALSSYLFRARSAGVSPMAVLRILQNKVWRLHAAQAAVHAGENPASAMKRVRPPVFFGEQRQFEQQLKIWPLRSLKTVMSDILDADLAAKTTGAPQREIAERALFRLAAIAERRR